MPITFEPSRFGIPGRNDDWNDYLRTVKQQDEWFQHQSTHSLSVLGETESYRHTISALSEVIRRDWNNLEPQDRQRLLGLTPEKCGWPLLGKMRDSALWQVFMFEANRRRIEAAVRTVAEAPDDDNAFLNVVITAYREICSIYGVGPGIASRLLTLARPDRCVSVNGASQRGLATEFRLAPTTLGHERNYKKLLQCVYQRPWFQAPEPEDPFEREIWSMRAALIDCFVYWPK